MIEIGGYFWYYQYETNCFQLVLRGVVGELLTGDDVLRVRFPANACWKMFVYVYCDPTH